VAEQADAADLKSAGPKARTGSSPVLGTRDIKGFRDSEVPFFFIAFDAALFKPDVGRTPCEEMGCRVYRFRRQYVS
jgi:hypothetical protein